jgi:hypothetical protein
MTASTVHEVVGILNADSTWDDPVRVAQLVESVGGARKNDQQLIDLMVNLSASRGYSALESELKRIATLIDDAAFLKVAVNDVIEAMARGARSEAVRAAAAQGATSRRAFPRALRDAVVLELRALATSQSFMSPLRIVLSGLRALVDGIVDREGPSPMSPLDGSGSSRTVLSRAWSIAGELVQGRSGALRAAVEEIVTLSQLVDGMLIGAMSVIIWPLEDRRRD